MSTAFEFISPQQIGICIFGHYPQQNKIHIQAMQQCQYLLRTKLPFPSENIGLHKIWYQLWCSSTLPFLLTSPILLQMANPVQDHF